MNTVANGRAMIAELIRFPDQKFSVICLANLNSIEPSELAQQVADLYLADQFMEQERPSSQEVYRIYRTSCQPNRKHHPAFTAIKNRDILKLSPTKGNSLEKLADLSFQLVADKFNSSQGD